jgi:hypothetical protein
MSGRIGLEGPYLVPQAGRCIEVSPEAHSSAQKGCDEPGKHSSDGRWRIRPVTALTPLLTKWLLLLSRFTDADGCPVPPFCSQPLQPLEPTAKLSEEVPTPLQ